MNTQKYDVVIIGGGLSGLTTALRLKQAGKESFVVIEAKDRVGGRTVRLHGSNGIHLDGGAQYIGPTQHRVLALAKELGITLFPVKEEGRTILIMKGKRTEYKGFMPLGRPLVLLDFLLAFLRLERMARKVDLEKPWQYKNADVLDKQTLAEWFDKHVRTYAARMLFDSIIGQTMGGNPKDVSVLWALEHIKSAGSFMELISADGGAQQWRTVENTWEMSNRIHEQIKEHVQLGNPVEKIEWSETGAHIYTKNGLIEAKKVVMAMSPADWNNIPFVPELPAARATLGTATTMVKDIKAHVVYEKPFWRDKGFSGEVIADMTPAPLVFDNTHPSYPQGILMMFIPGEAGEHPMLPSNEQLQDKETRKREVLRCLVEYFGEEAAHPIDYIEQDWRHTAYTEGCIPAMKPGTVTNIKPLLHETDGPFIWAGSESSHVWASYMDGAVRSGERAAALVTEVTIES